MRRLASLPASLLGSTICECTPGRCFKGRESSQSISSSLEQSVRLDIVDTVVALVDTVDALAERASTCGY